MCHESIFVDQLTSVIVEQAKGARDWDKFINVAKRCGLKKVLTVAGQVAKGHSSSSFHSLKGQGEHGGLPQSNAKKGGH